MFIMALQSVRYLGPKMWVLVPSTTKYCNSLSKFTKLSRGNQRYAPTGCVRHTLPKYCLSNYIL